MRFGEEPQSEALLLCSYGGCKGVRTRKESKHGGTQRKRGREGKRGGDRERDRQTAKYRQISRLTLRNLRQADRQTD